MFFTRVVVMKVLLSIKPEFANKILTGEKRFEFRKSLFKRTGITTVIIYATMPVGKVIGEFDIDLVISNSPQEVWSMTSEYSGITKSFFDSYFTDRDMAYAIKVKKVRKYDTPQDLDDVKHGLKAPQSYVYI
jgi:predicted transcriptional regulator